MGGATRPQLATAHLAVFHFETKSKFEHRRSRRASHPGLPCIFFTECVKCSEHLTQAFPAFSSKRHYSK